MRIRNTLLSASFFIPLLFVRKRYDVIFIYQNTFNRKGGENLLLKPFVETCKKNNLSYLILESRSYQKKTGYRYIENSEAVPFNFIAYLRIKLRRFFRVKGADEGLGPQWVEREKKIARFLHALFFKNLETKIFVTLAGLESVLFLKFIYPNATFAEYQHGVFWCPTDQKSLYLNIFRRKYLTSQTYLLTYGDAFREIYAQCPQISAFPTKNIKTIGYYLEIPGYKKRKNNKTILYTLQNIDMQNNDGYYSSIRTLIEVNAVFLEKHGYSILFRNHPRYERNDVLTFEKSYPFVSFVEDQTALTDFEGIALHITSKSTTAFDAALHSLPTLFIDLFKPRSPKKIFFDQYHYPLEDFNIAEAAQLSLLLKKLEKQAFYLDCSSKVYLWVREYYQNFDQKRFLDLIEESQ